MSAPENYGGIDRSKTDDFGVPTDGGKPVKVTQGMVANVILLVGNEKEDREACDLALRLVHQGQDVMIGTSMFVDRFLFGAVADEEE